MGIPKTRIVMMSRAMESALQIAMSSLRLRIRLKTSCRSKTVARRMTAPLWQLRKVGNLKRQLIISLVLTI